MKVILGQEAESILKSVVSFPKSQYILKKEQRTIKSPVVLKLISQKLVHKTESGGVKIVRTESEIDKAFLELETIAKTNKTDYQIQVQEFLVGQECIIGIKKDSTFGHVIVFGMGGIFTEVLKDTSTRKCPITYIDAEGMISELRAHALFEGARGIKLNKKVLINTLVKLSQFPSKHKNLQGLDINPFILNDKSGYAVDARIIVEE